MLRDHKASNNRASRSKSEHTVEHPNEVVRRLKQKLAEKKGIPVAQQRLVFSKSALDPSDSQKGTAAEQLLQDLGHSRALIYQNQKAIGCLLNPEISISEGVESSKEPESDQEGCEEISLLLVSLSYSHWQLAGSDRTSVRLGIDLDQTFEQSLFRLQVYCKRGDQTFALPLKHSFSGALLAAAARVELQRQEYIRLHQLKRQAAPPLGFNQKLCSVKLGENLGGLQATFDTSQRPLRLETLALGFAVGASLQALDEGFTLSSSPPMSSEHSKSSTKLPNKESPRAQPSKQVVKKGWSMDASKNSKASTSKDVSTKGRAPKLGPQQRTAISQSSGSPSSSQSASWRLDQTPNSNHNQSLAQGPSPSLIETILGSRADSLAEALGHSEEQQPRAPDQQQAAGRDERGAASPRRLGKGTAGAAVLPVEGNVNSPAKPSRPSGLDVPIMQGGPSGKPRAPAKRPSGSDPQEPALRGNDSRPKPTQQKYMPPQKRQQAALQAAKRSDDQNNPSERPALPAVAVRSGPGTKPRSPLSPLVAPPPAFMAGEAGSSRDAITWLSKSLISPQPRSPPVRIDMAKSSLKAPPAACLQEDPHPTPPPAALLPTRSSGGTKQATLPRRSALDNSVLDMKRSTDVAQQSRDEMVSRDPDSFTTAQSSTENSEDPHGSTAFAERVTGSSTSGGSLETAYSISESDPITPKYEHAGPAVAPESYPSAVISGLRESFHPLSTSDINRRGVTELENDVQNQFDSARTGSAHGNSGLPHMAASSSQAPRMLTDTERAQMAENWREIGTVAWDQSLMSSSSNANFHSNLEVSSETRSDSSESREQYGFQHLPNGMGVYGISEPGEPGLLEFGAEGRFNGAGNGVPENGVPWLGHLPTRPLSERNFSTRSTEDSPLPRGFDTTPLPAGVFLGPGESPMYGSRSAGLQFPNGFHNGQSQEGNLDALWASRALGGLQGEYAAIPGFPMRGSESDLRRANTQGSDGRRDDDLGRPWQTLPSPPPPPPPRLGQQTVETLELASSLIERQGSFQVPSPIQATAFEARGPPTSDLERFVASVTPVLHPSQLDASAKDLTLGHVWQFYEDASSFGMEVYTRGGRRGSALAYYTPTLSAIRALLPCKDSDRQAGEVRVIPIVQHFEVEPPFNREPLHNAVTSLASSLHCDTLESDWHDVQLGRLHPASWFAVTWYPIYRIPDAPLSAKFLTYHSFTPKGVWQTYFGVQDTPLEEAGIPAEGETAMCLPLLGLKCAEQRNEPWIEPYSHSPIDRREWEERYQQLQQNARSLSVGRNLRIQAADGTWLQPSSVHNDLDWFNRHP